MDRDRVHVDALLGNVKMSGVLYLQEAKAMKTVKQHAKYTIVQRGDSRYAVRSKSKQRGKKWINGDDKVTILAEEGLLTKPQAKAKPKPATEDAFSEPQ